MESITFSPLGDQGLIVDFGEGMNLEKNRFILKWRLTLEAHPFPGFIEAVPAYTTLTIFYDAVAVGTSFPYDTVKKAVKNISFSIHHSVNHNKTVEIPVCYEEPFSLDLKIVAMHNKKTIQEVIDIHCANIYHVYFLGFSPGFPFLGGMNKSLSTPRKNVPRLKIPRGSVGIAGGQTGIYPLESPGGWQIIGRTPLQLFDVYADPPTLILPGDQVRFVSINKEEFFALEE
ncbi:5-oxoprolinase subunit PxpB [Bacillus sp. FSL K6-3431]|uniref:5-oxoprolinase subunit PxpB n=1 Tax=Bacillus sp. FSL K6-3431 TaxID=2921500 RepID=UPI0030F5C87A